MRLKEEELAKKTGELGKVQEELEETLRLSDAKDDELEKLREEVNDKLRHYVFTSPARWGWPPPTARLVS